MKIRGGGTCFGQVPSLRLPALPAEVWAEATATHLELTTRWQKWQQRLWEQQSDLLGREAVQRLAVARAWAEELLAVARQSFAAVALECGQTLERLDEAALGQTLPAGAAPTIAILFGSRILNASRGLHGGRRLCFGFVCLSSVCVQNSPHSTFFYKKNAFLCLLCCLVLCVLASACMCGDLTERYQTFYAVRSVPIFAGELDFLTASAECNELEGAERLRLAYAAQTAFALLWAAERVAGQVVEAEVKARHGLVEDWWAGFLLLVEQVGPLLGCVCARARMCAGVRACARVCPISGAKRAYACVSYFDKAA